MRIYRGERHPDGSTRVWIDDEPEPPTPREIVDLLADLRPIRESWSHDPEWEVARDAWMARKHDLLARIEASKTRNRRPLLHPDGGSADGFDWGTSNTGAIELAEALLTHHLGVEPTEPIVTAFRDSVIVGFGEDRLYAPASLIGAWVAAHRRLIEHELFLNEPHDVAHAVTDTEPADADAVEVDPATASQLVAACEAAWADIRTHHPDLPPAVVVLGSGIERGRLVKLGHWWGGQWVADSSESRGEVLLAGEALHLGPNAVFEILLHEAAHGINAARGVRDTSRGGRYHNRQFANTAREALLDVQPMPPYGLARTALTPAAEDRYADTIGRLGDAIRIARQIRRGVRIGDDHDPPPPGGGPDETEGGETKRKDNGAAACGCGRKLRMAPSTLAAGPVTCGLCHTEFQPVVQRTADTERSAVVDDTFVARRTAELRAAEPDVQHRSEAPATVGRERDAEALGRWYGDFGTEHEQPMPAGNPDEAARRARMARAILRADGTLAGPTVTTPAGTELQAGDRVHATRGVDDLPAGTLGTVEHVDPDGGTVDIDFATWGRLRVQLEEAIVGDLRHDYVTVATPGGDAGVELPGIEQ